MQLVVLIRVLGAAAARSHAVDKGPADAWARLFMTAQALESLESNILFFIAIFFKG